VSTLENDIEFAELAVELVDGEGRDVAVEIDTLTNDPLTGKVNVTATATHNVKCSPPSPVRERYVDGDVIRIGDMMTYFKRDGLPFTPVLGMRVDDRWTATRVDPLISGNQTAAFRVFLHG
jgi:hypothetical protein